MLSGKALLSDRLYLVRRNLKRAMIVGTLFCDLSVKDTKCAWVLRLRRSVSFFNESDSLRIIFVWNLRGLAFMQRRTTLDFGWI